MKTKQRLLLLESQLSSLETRINCLQGKHDLVFYSAGESSIPNNYWVQWHWRCCDKLQQESVTLNQLRTILRENRSIIAPSEWKNKYERFFFITVNIIEAEKLSLRLIAKDVEKLQKRIKELEVALKKYGTHTSSCAYIQGLRGQSTEEKCDCGFEQALKG